MSNNPAIVIDAMETWIEKRRRMNTARKAWKLSMKTFGVIIWSMHVRKEGIEVVVMSPTRCTRGGKCWMPGSKMFPWGVTG